MDAAAIDKLIKLLRMMTSSHDHEALSAARRACGLLQAEGADWGDVVGGGSAPELSQDQMRRIHEAGFKAGYEKGVEAGRQIGAGRLWQSGAEAPASKRDEVGDDFGRLRRALEAAESERLRPFEEEFFASMRERVERYGKGTFVSPKQWAVIERFEERIGL